MYPSTTTSTISSPMTIPFRISNTWPVSRKSQQSSISSLINEHQNTGVSSTRTVLHRVNEGIRGHGFRKFSNLSPGHPIANQRTSFVACRYWHTCAIWISSRLLFTVNHETEEQGIVSLSTFYLVANDRTSVSGSIHVNLVRILRRDVKARILIQRCDSTCILDLGNRVFIHDTSTRRHGQLLMLPHKSTRPLFFSFNMSPRNSKHLASSLILDYKILPTVLNGN